MVNRSVPGQLDLFPVADFQTSNAASNFDMGLSLSNVSTRTKVFISPHRPISKETIESIAVKLTSLPSLNSPKPLPSKD